MEPRLGMPGLRCDHCGEAWAQTGMAFPEIELPGSVDEEPYTTRWPVSNERFAELVAPVRTRFPSSLEIRPGLQFGRLTGAVMRIDHSDFFWINPWTLVTTRPIAEVLSSQLGIRFVAAELRAVGWKPDLVELCVPPAARARSETAQTCSRCGREDIKRNNLSQLCVGAQEDLPALFRITNFPTIVIGSASFVGLVRSRSWRGIEPRTVDLVWS